MRVGEEGSPGGAVLAWVFSVLAAAAGTGDSTLRILILSPLSGVLPAFETAGDGARETGLEAATSL